MKTEVAIDDHYDPVCMFRRDVFNLSLDYLEAENLSERQVIECLKQCLDFFYSSTSQDVVRDFCIVKVKRAEIKHAP